jgi:multidrug efflux pump subunit AcrA (membrane-fusion protein)
VRFFALPNREFTGKVSSIAPVVLKEKRVLNVQFTVEDPENVVRPGMFAEIGVGTDKREALLMPADGVLHVGDKDYALHGGNAGTWEIADVETGELRGTSVEVLAGLKAGDRVLGKGAILLKPVVAHALEGSVMTPHGSGMSKPASAP